MAALVSVFPGDVLAASVEHVNHLFFFGYYLLMQKMCEFLPFARSVPAAMSQRVDMSEHGQTVPGHGDRQTCFEGHRGKGQAPRER